MKLVDKLKGNKIMLPTIEKLMQNYFKIDINEKLAIWFFKDSPVAFRSDSNIFVTNNITPRHLKKITASHSSYSPMPHDKFKTLLIETFETCNYHVNSLKRPTNWAPYLTSMGTP